MQNSASTCRYAVFAQTSEHHLNIFPFYDPMVHMKRTNGKWHKIRDVGYEVAVRKSKNDKNVDRLLLYPHDDM